MRRHQEEREPSFSIFEFRYWLMKQPDDKVDEIKKPEPVNEGILGVKVEPRIGIQRLEMQIAKHNEGMNEVAALAKSFKLNGGTIVDATDLHLTVESNSVRFIIPIIFTKFAD